MAKKKKVKERNSASSGTYRPKSQRYGSQYGASSSQNYGSSNPYGNSNIYGNSNTYGNSNIYGSTSPVSGYSSALDQHLSKFPSNRTPYWGSTDANQSSNQNNSSGLGYDNYEGGHDPNRPDTGYSSPTGNYPEPGWPEPGDAETPTYPTPSPTIPDIFFPSPSGDMPPFELPPALIESLSITPPGLGFNFSMPNLDAPEISRIDIPDPGPLGFYSVNEGAAGWSGRGGNVDDLDRFVAGKVGGPEPVRFRAAFG